jgi:hypothetical protein
MMCPAISLPFLLPCPSNSTSKLFDARLKKTTDEMGDLCDLLHWLVPNCCGILWKIMQLQQCSDRGGLYS